MKLGILFLLLLCTACEMREVEEIADPSPPSSQLTHTTGPLAPLTAEAEPLVEPARYRVSLKWKPESVGLLLFRKHADAPYEKLQFIPAHTESSFDDQVIAGESYHYALFHCDPLQKPKDKLAEVQIKIPLDIVIRGARTTKEIRGVRRLYLASGAVLSPSEGTLKIEVEELHADKSVIQTLAGGILQIEARHAFGALSVIARGKNGEPGVDGGEGHPGSKGPPGRDGVIAAKVPPALLSSFMEQLNRTGYSQLSLEEKKAAFECRAAPGNGGDGTRGARGGKGGKGLTGGDSGKIWIRVRFPEELDLTTLVEPGKGGAGGRAGTGGLGGPGGEPGKDFDICKRAKAGKPGERGEEGARGDDGAEGKTLPSCLWLGSTKVGECDSPTLGI